MIGGGEFIINGAERVVVSQLHRSPGVDFVIDTTRHRPQAPLLPHHPRARQLDRGERHQEGHPRRPYRPVGQVLVHDAAPRHGPGLLVRRRHPPRLLSDGDPSGSTRPTAKRLTGRLVVGDVIDPETGEVYLESGETFTPEKLDVLYASPVKEVTVLQKIQRPAHPDLAQGRPDQHARRSAAEDLPAPASGQPAAAGKGPRTVQGEVPGRQPLPPGQGRPLPHQP